MTRPPVPPARLAVLVEELQACPAPVRQAACSALAAVVELQAGLARVLVPAAARGAPGGAVASHSLDHTSRTR